MYIKSFKINFNTLSRIIVEIANNGCVQSRFYSFQLFITHAFLRCQNLNTSDYKHACKHILETVISSFSYCFEFFGHVLHDWKSTSIHFFYNNPVYTGFHRSGSRLAVSIRNSGRSTTRSPDAGGAPIHFHYIAKTNKHVILNSA